MPQACFLPKYGMLIFISRLTVLLSTISISTITNTPWLQVQDAFLILIILILPLALEPASMPSTITTALELEAFG